MVNNKNNAIQKDYTLTATGMVIAVIAVSLLVAYFNINAVLKERSISRMEEGVKTVISEITSKFERDSRILNAMAKVISQADNLNADDTGAIIEANSTLLETMHVRVLMANDLIILPDGSTTDASEIDNISFKTEAPLGEHISGRVTYGNSDKPILRHYVPIVQDGRTVALLYGVTELKNLRNSLNIDNIYNASASVYIIDTQTGDFLLDTWHNEPGSLADFASDVYPIETKGSKDWDQGTDDIVHMKSDYVIFRTPNTDGWQYMYYSPSGINNWAIAVQVPESEAFASVFITRRICIALGILLAITIIIYYIWVRSNAKKIREQAVEQAVLTAKLQKAEAADKAKSTFLSNMSHDIRTPMNAIIGYTTLVQTNLDNRERTQEYLKKILSSSNHMLSLINDILDMSRIESGKLNIEEKECSISDIFRDLRNIMQTQMQSKQLNFFMDTIDVIDEDIYCDKLHVNQVLLNLLSNAIKFTPSGGTVAMSIRQKPQAPKGYGSYEIRVKDTGIGMSKEFIGHIFEPFERERNTTASGIQGTGLGMAITKNIVDTLGGTIEVQSEQGKGTEFVINLDFRLRYAERQVETVNELMGLRALIADDSFVTCDSVSKMLRQIGMRPDWVLHGKEAVLHAKQAHELGDSYHAYIIDWFMPDLSGLEVVRQIRAIIGDETPIIIVTAYDWTDFEDEARKAGVTAFCNKPIFLSELRDILIASTSKSLPKREEKTVNAKSLQITGKRLLLVEDNELNREIATELLTEKGFMVEEAEDGSIALEKIKISKPGYYSLVLMDIQMPNMNGYEATKAIRSLDDQELAAIPIVAMTANAFDEDRKQALECGMNAHIAKPIDVEKLLDVLSSLLDD